MENFFLLLVNLFCVHIGNFLYFWNYHLACLLVLLLLSIYNFQGIISFSSNAILWIK